MILPFLSNEPFLRKWLNFGYTYLIFSETYMKLIFKNVSLAVTYKM